MLTGVLTVAVWSGGLASLHGYWVPVTLALGVVLAADSLVALVGPRRIFYSSALLSALLAGSDWIGSGSTTSTAILLTVAAAAVTLVLAIVAARFEPEVSEQSHPMNLPVFG